MHKSDIAACDFDGGCFGDSGDSVISEAFNAVRGEAEIFLRVAPESRKFHAVGTDGALRFTAKVFREAGAVFACELIRK